MKIAAAVITLACWTPAAFSNCVVSTPNLPDPPGAMKTGPSWGWFGTGELAAMIPVDGQWQGMGPANHYSDKWWWWREHFDAKKEPQPDLTVTGRRLDDEARPLEVSGVTSGFQQDWDAMLFGPRFPSAGCWEVVGHYQERVLRIFLQVGKPD